MPEPEREASTQIAGIQREADHAVRAAAIEIAKLGGQDAVAGYLNSALCNLLGVAIVQQGHEAACELMAHGLLTAEGYTDERLMRP